MAPRKRASLARALPAGRWRRAAAALALLSVGAFATASLGILYLRWLPPLTTALQLQRRLEGVKRNREVPSRFVALGELPAHVGRAVVAAEDARFYEHAGVDWTEVEKAAQEGWREGEPPRGASTITQQLVKNLFLTTHGSFARKAIELPLAYLTELILPKRRILELYLNVVEWGAGIYGIEAAARYHYGVDAVRLSREQAARLAAILPAPRTRDPARMGRATERILLRMRQMGW